MKDARRHSSELQIINRRNVFDSLECIERFQQFHGRRITQAQAHNKKYINYYAAPGMAITVLHTPHTVLLMLDALSNRQRPLLFA